MKTYRVIAALLALVMLLGMFSGCSKNGSETTDPANPSNNPGTKTETNDEKGGKHQQVRLSGGISSDSRQRSVCEHLDDLGFEPLLHRFSIIDGKQTYTDENGEETEYDNYRSALFKLDVETGDCTELTEFQLPEVP